MLAELQKQLLYLKAHWLTQDIIINNYIWFAISPDWAYSPEIQKLTPIKNLDNNLIYDITDFFTTDLAESNMARLEYRVSRLDALYHYIVSCNPKLDQKRIGYLLYANLEQTYNEHTR